MLLLAIAIALATGAGAAYAAIGDLTGQGCITDAGHGSGCSGQQQGLHGAQSVAVSPDGKSVYVASALDQALARFDRDPATGALTPAGCISDVGDPAGCGATAQGLGAPRGVAVSADGESVYVVSGTVPGTTENAVVAFDRDNADPGTGTLTPIGCISDVGDPATCGLTQQGLADARGIAVSPDGKSVYAVANGDDAIVRFNRSTVDGTLAVGGCVGDVGDPAGCGGTPQQGLDGAWGVAVSADNTSVYVAALTDSAVVRFDRNTADGSLTGQGCIADVGDAAGCGATQQGLLNADVITTSPDNNSVYVGSLPNEATIVRFDRNSSSGALTGQGCIADPGDAAGCGVTQLGLSSVRGIAVSPDGNSVYATGFNSQSIVNFDRAANGALTPKACIMDIGFAGCGANVQGLQGPNGVAVSPDNASVYVASASDRAVVNFFRSTSSGGGPPIPPPVEPEVPGNPPQPAPAPFGSAVSIGSPNGNKIIITVPGLGQLKLDDKGKTVPKVRTADATRAKAKNLLKPSTATAEEAGEVTMTIRLTKPAKKTYKQKGKLKVPAEVLFTPETGDPIIETATLKLKKE